MKTFIALIAAVLTLGIFAPGEAQAGHRYRYSRNCHSGPVIYLSASYGGHSHYNRPYYGSYYHCRPAYAYYPRYSHGCGYRTYGYSYPRYRSYGYRYGYCR